MKSKLITFLKMLGVTCALLLLFTKTGLVDDNNKGGKAANGAYTMYDFAMGTSFNLEIYGGNAEDVAQACMDIVNEVDTQYLSRRADTSELCKLNQEFQESRSVNISDKLYNVLYKTELVCEASNGAFDYTVLPVSVLWNIEDADLESFAVPSEAAIADALQLVGYRHLELSNEDNGHFVTTDIANVKLELGAVGKGYVLDELRDYLQGQTAVTGAVIHAGGSVLVYGSKEDASNWRVGIRNPKGNVDDIIGYIEFHPETTICISTSGDYEKYIEKDGNRYHHIMDAISGAPANSGLSSVTVVCEDGLYSDALSTACFILGYDKSMPLLKQFGAEAIFIDNDNHIVCTEGIKDKYHSL